MLDALRKKFFNSSTEGNASMAQEETQAPTLAVDNTAELATAQAALASQTEAFTALQAQLAEVTTKFEVAQAALAEIEAAKAALVAEAAEKKFAARKEKVELAIGTAKAPALLEATESLDDAAFEAVVAAMAGSVEAESKTDLFREIGASGSVDASKVADEGAVMKALKTKYANKQ